MVAGLVLGVAKRNRPALQAPTMRWAGFCEFILVLFLPRLQALLCNYTLYIHLGYHGVVVVFPHISIAPPGSASCFQEDVPLDSGGYFGPAFCSEGA